MPLPRIDQPWPPKNIQAGYDLMDVHDSWYTGDVDMLAATYGNQRYANHPAQYRGGVVGAVARFWWGKPVAQGEDRVKLHLPLPSDIATMSADLLFSEPPRFVLPDASKTSTDGTMVKSKQQEAVEAVVNVPQVFTALLEAAELGSALGGVYLRLIWDTSQMDHVRIDPVAADAAVPTFSNGALRDVYFWTVVSDIGDSTVLRHVELHEPGRITHALYEGQSDSVGRQVPIAQSDALAWLTTIDGDGVSRDALTVTLATGVTGLTSCYIPNILPNRLFRKNGFLSSFGRSDYSGVETAFDAIDEAWSSWARDVRLAKARIIVPSAYLNNGGAGQGASFDMDREVYEGLEFLSSDPGSKTITPQQFGIRWEEHRATITEWTRYALRSAGYSGYSLGESDGGEGSRTATQVTAEERLSERTRDKKTNYWKAELGRFGRTWLELEAKIYRNRDLILSEYPEVRFPAESQQDPEEMAQIAALQASSASASVMTRVRGMHPDWDGSTVNEEVQRIYQELGIGPAQEPDAATYKGILANAMSKPMLPDEAREMEDAAKKRASGQDVVGV